MADLKELRAAKARAQATLRAAEDTLARIQTGWTAARQQLSEQLASGARVGSQTATLTAKIQSLEQAQDEAEQAVEVARDALADAETNEQEFMVDAAESAQTNAPSTHEVLEQLLNMLDEAQTDALRKWLGVAIGMVRTLLAIDDAKPEPVFAGRTARQHLGEALRAHLDTYKSLAAGATSVNLIGELRVPDDAGVEHRGVSHGGRDRLHWETPVVFQGRRGTAYVELYLTRR